MQRFLRYLYAIFIIASLIWLYSRHEVFATGGAFTSTKHGGGTTDGVLPYDAGNGPGVDRSVNPDYTTKYYNSASAGAGKYKGGECSQCHEPHASFGGYNGEPPPNSTTGDTAGPTAYLIMKGDYNSGTQGANANLCWYCHENMTISPSATPGNGRFDFYQGKAKYTASGAATPSGHYNNANFKWPGTTGDPVTIWPRLSRSSLPAGNTGSCLNCHTPHGIKESSTAGQQFDTTAVPASPTNKHLSANNADVSTDYLNPRQLIAWEEALCENCHKAGSTQPYIDAKAIKEQIDCLTPSASTPCGGTGGNTAQGSGHPVHNVDQTGGTGTTFSGRHSLKNETSAAIGAGGSWNAYSNSTRHVECVDCHNPHAVQNATVFQCSGTQAGCATNTNRQTGANGVYAGGANKGVWGASITDYSTGAIGGRSDDTSPSNQNYSSLYLYQICLKCHSTFADSSLTSNATPSWSNRSRWETTTAPGYYFGATQMSLSNVATDFAMDTTPITGSLLKGYHPVFGLGRNQPPSAANCRWSRLRLDASCTPVSGGNESSTRPTGVRDTTIGFANNFVPPWGPASVVTCVDCHESENESAPRGPHGSDRPFILRKLNTSITYTVVDDGYAGNGAGAYTVNYSSFDQGWVSTSDNYGLAAGTVGSLGTWDPNNFCLNCHRADVYGFLDQAYTSGSGVCGDNRFPRYRYLARQPHPADGNCGGMGAGQGNSFDSYSRQNNTGAPPRGIVCLRCHGGGTVGGIHGNRGAGYTYTLTNITPSSNRLLDGTAWTGVTFSSASATGSCTKNNGATLFNACTNGNSGSFDTRATYNY